MPKLFAISDLHLSFSADKPMNIFGSRWDNYEERLRQNWQEQVSKDDVVLMPGDTSWATYVKDAACDFHFIEKLNGTKIISKGNHDYWWETLSKLNLFLEKVYFILWARLTIYEQKKEYIDFFVERVLDYIGMM